MRSRFWGGSVLNFVVIGVTLVALLLVGAYVAKRYVAQTDHGEVAVNDSQHSSTDKSENKSDKSKSSKGDEADQSATDQSGQVDEGNNGSVSEDSPSEDGGDIPTAGVEIPQTGPADLGWSAAGLASLTGASVFYVSSRRQS